jgi:hypothetical protein
MSEARTASQIYWFDNGPGHTLDFTPDSYVDVTAEWESATDWLGKLMAFVQNKPFDPRQDAAMETKTTLARYRGLACGAKYAEALRAVRPVARELW